jgi:hypothetical protein
MASRVGEKMGQADDSSIYGNIQHAHEHEPQEKRLAWLWVCTSTFCLLYDFLIPASDSAYCYPCSASVVVIALTLKKALDAVFTLIRLTEGIGTLKNCLTWMSSQKLR